MNNLFDDAEKLVKFNRSLSQQLQIKNVLNPYTQLFINVQLANRLKILSNGYYRNRYGNLIPLNIAASKGLIEFIINDEIDYEEMEIEYRSKHYPIITNLLIHQVYDSINKCMITFRQAIDNNYLDIELFIYSCSNISMSIHEAFYCGLIIGELRTNIIEQEFPKQIININEKYDFDYDILFLLLKTIVNNLNEFINTIKIIDECQLTSDGYIQHKKTRKCYLLTQAIELGLVSFQDSSQITPFNNSKVIK
ncbi:unnamed protein product [Rotaria sordida]|uniref:Uncharacterized protein n=1 Tax=Rotaria sordida TaxID=392033 RepID=A0A818R5T7_9BILA|nr:unnamed protein product [Rotaria sordida]CAF3652369.1 unnamed protein product [Rotaria sordida]